MGILIADIGDSDVVEQDLRESTGDHDLGVEYGEMVVESYEGNVLLSDDSEGGEGVSTLYLRDVMSSSGSESFGESIEEVYNGGDAKSLSLFKKSDEASEY